jgi:hypothetical protein
MADFDFAPEWASRHAYYHHSNPSKPDSATFFDKGVRRPAVNNAWKVLKGKVDGNAAEARKTIDSHSYANINMTSGNIVQHYCDAVLLHGEGGGEAYRSAVNELHDYRPPAHNDLEKEMSIVFHRENPIYGIDGTKPRNSDDAGCCELELVCNYALEGLREALSMNGINEVEGEVDLWGQLDGCELKYNGRPDYCRRIELKTMWDRQAHTDKPAANSLPAAATQLHKQQVAGYWKLSGLLPTIVVANRLGCRIFQPSEDELRDTLQAVTQACQRRERLLKAATTPQELMRLCDPQWDHFFAWKDLHPDVIRQAKEIYRG